MNYLKKITALFIFSIFVSFPCIAFAASDTVKDVIEAEQVAITELDSAEINEIPVEQNTVEEEQNEESASDNNSLVELELNKKYDIYQGEGRFLYTPKETGDYQFWLELEPNGEQYVFGVGMTDEKPPISVGSSKKGNDYQNVYLKAGNLYDFYIGGCKAVTLKKEPVATLNLSKAVQGEEGDGNIFVFIPKDRGRYMFSLKQYNDGTTFGSLVLYNENSGGKPDDYLEKSIIVEAGERCYITAWDCKNLTVKKIGYQDENPRIAELWMLRDQSQLYIYPPFEAGNENNRFSVNDKSGVCKAKSSLKKPWLAVTVDSEAAIPILKNSKGETIAWRETQVFRNGRKIYSTPLGINSSKRKYTLTIIPESGNKKNTKIYDLTVNDNSS